MAMQAMEKAASWDFEKACEIQEFVEFKQQHLRCVASLPLFVLRVGVHAIIVLMVLFLCSG